MKGPITLQDLQNYIKEKDHKPDLKRDYYLKLVEEVGELAESIRKGQRMGNELSIKGTVEEELFDVLYYVVALANVHNIDLEQCFYLKEELNKHKY